MGIEKNSTSIGRLPKVFCMTRAGGGGLTKNITFLNLTSHQIIFTKTSNIIEYLASEEFTLLKMNTMNYKLYDR